MAKKLAAGFGLVLIAVLLIPTFGLVGALMIALITAIFVVGGTMVRNG